MTEDAALRARAEQLAQRLLTESHNAGYWNQTTAVALILAAFEDVTRERQRADEEIALAIMTALGPLVADAAIVGATYGWNEVMTVVRAAGARLQAERRAREAAEQVLLEFDNCVREGCDPCDYCRHACIAALAATRPPRAPTP